MMISFGLHISSRLEKFITLPASFVQIFIVKGQNLIYGQRSLRYNSHVIKTPVTRNVLCLSSGTFLIQLSVFKTPSPQFVHAQPSIKAIKISNQS